MISWSADSTGTPEGDIAGNARWAAMVELGDDRRAMGVHGAGQLLQAGDEPVVIQAQ